MRPLSVIMALCLSLLALPGRSTWAEPVQEKYTFTVHVKTVYVDVFVARDDKPVTGLTRDNFEVRDNGVLQEINLIDIETVPMSALLVLDVSSSVRGQKLNHLRAAAHAFVDGLGEYDEAGLLTFSQNLRLWKSLDNDFVRLHRAIDQPTGGGSTALNDALFTGLKVLESAHGRPLLLLFSDGLDMASILEETAVLQVAEASETIVYAVGVRSRGGVYRKTRLLLGPGLRASRLLERITRSTGGLLWYVDSTANLKDVYLAILAEMETRYLLTYQPRGVSEEEGWHEIEVKLKGQKADEIRARPGYLVSPTLQ